MNDEPEILKLTGYDEAILGIADVWQSNTQVSTLIYCAEKLTKLLMCDNMTEDEAVEYIEYNIQAAYVGNSTPIIVWPFDESKL